MAKTSLETVSCEGCGVCCMHMAVPPYDEEELDELKEGNPAIYADYQAVMKSRDLQLTAHGTDFIPCGFLDMITRKCRHHDNNPDVCRRFKVGGESCRQFREDVAKVLSATRKCEQRSQVKENPT